jgi:hypothetical protein
MAEKNLRVASEEVRLSIEAGSRLRCVKD